MFLREPLAKQVNQESQPDPRNKLEKTQSEEAGQSEKVGSLATKIGWRSNSSKNFFDPRAKAADQSLLMHKEVQERRAPPVLYPATTQIRKRLSKSQKDKNVKVFFKSLKKSSTLESVVHALSEFGQLKYVRLPFSKTKKRNMGYGYAIYEDGNDAIDLLRTNKNVLVDGKPVTISSFSFAKNTSSPRNEVAFCFDQSALSEDSELGGNNSKTTESIKPGLHAIKPTCSEFYLLRGCFSKLANSQNLRFSICIEHKAIPENRK